VFDKKTSKGIRSSVTASWWPPVWAFVFSRVGNLTKCFVALTDYLDEYQHNYDSHIQVSNNRINVVVNMGNESIGISSSAARRVVVRHSLVLPFCESLQARRGRQEHQYWPAVGMRVSEDLIALCC
jgi:hypothetical protein